MSKIEEALKKAVESGSAKYPGNSISVDVDKSSSTGTKNLVVVKRNADLRIRKHESIKEIARMKNDNLLTVKQLSDLKVISTDMHDEKIANSYRDLRTKIIQRSVGTNAVILITSCVAGDESAMATINMATAFSFDESRTSLIVDCDFHKSKIEKILDVKVGSGLIDYLEDDSITQESIIHDSGIKRLRIIPAGKSREVETEYFTSIKMKGLINSVFSRYPDRHVFINSRPIVESADTRILADMSNYVLLVVPYGKATPHKISEAVRQIDPGKFLGVVFVDKPKVPKKALFNWFAKKQ